MAKTESVSRCILETCELYIANCFGMLVLSLCKSFAPHHNLLNLLYYIEIAVHTTFNNH